MLVALARNVQQAVPSNPMPTDNIVQLKPKQDPRVWVCGHCGCQNFLLYEDGTTECALCRFKDAEQRGGWAEHTKPDPDFDPGSLVPRYDTDHGTADLAKAVILKSVDADAVGVVVVWPNGKIRLWSVFSVADTPERQGWFRRILQTAADVAFGVASDPGNLPE